MHARHLQRPTLDDFYCGFEGYARYEFRNGRDAVTLVRAWAGDVDAIFELIESEADGWTSLARVYHLHVGWFESSPWRVSDVQSAYLQLTAIDPSALELRGRHVWEAMTRVLKAALDARTEVWIAYD